jgi:glycosyltransferase involved in cell wall biosynthesis
LVVDEFFGGAGTAFGGYGCLARKYIAKYIHGDDIKIDVLLGKSKKYKMRSRKYRVDNVDLYKLPHRKLWRRLWLWFKNYDAYLSIELTYPDVLDSEPRKNKKLILWMHDPRPKTVWNWIETMQSIKDPCFYNQKSCDAVHRWNAEKRVKFISQGYSLNPLGIELYNLPADTPIQYLPNPVETDADFVFDVTKKKKQIIFLARVEAQKRAWLFCEIAKQMPEYEFLVMGRLFRHREDNERMLSPYVNGGIKNLHFLGHVDGEEKKKIMRESRLLVSTSIWEGIPISWLEALSFGILLVTDLERENLASRFGEFVGEIPGDGFDGVEKFIPAIKKLMTDGVLYEKTARAAIEYIAKTHSVSRFVRDIKDVIYQEV